MDQACRIALTETRAALAKYPEIEKVVFAVFNADALAVYRETFARLFGQR
jgi:hypothetical protein